MTRRRLFVRSPDNIPMNLRGPVLSTRGGCMLAVPTPWEHLRPLALPRRAIPPSPLSDRVGHSDHVRFRGYIPVHCRSGLQLPCLRFATAVT